MPKLHASFHIDVEAKGIGKYCKAERKNDKFSLKEDC